MTTAHKLILTAAFFTPAFVAATLVLVAAHFVPKDQRGSEFLDEVLTAVAFVVVIGFFFGLPVSAWVDWVFIPDPATAVAR